MAEHELPLAERRDESAGPSAEDENAIIALVSDFYGRARQDPLLGPVFDRHVEDWDAHLRTMSDFWSAALLRTGRYSGRPIEAHRAVREITGEHFDRWLALFDQSARATLGDRAPHAVTLALRMGDSMRRQLRLSA